MDVIVSKEGASHSSAGVQLASIRSNKSDSGSYLIAYSVFWAFAISYFWYYLPQDFSYTDEGYLIGLGHRMALGQLIYVDFDFLRPPLSPLIQAFFIKTFGSGYTVLWSKTIWAIQATATVFVASYIYREWMSRPLFTITLVATLLYSTLLFAFPWYTYDGMFFASLFALSVFRSRFLLAGVFAGLAFLCKQGFLALLPMTFAYLFVLTFIERSSWKSQTGNLIRASAGWGIPVAITSVIFLFYGAFDEMVANVFTLPQRVNPTSLSFILFQDLPEIAVKFAAPALVVLAVYLVRNLLAVRLVMLLALVISLSDIILISKYELPRFMIIAIYSVALLSLYKSLSKIRRKEEGLTAEKKVALATVLGIALLYVASINYSGVVFSYVGGVVGLPMLIIAFGNPFGPGPHAKPFHDGESAEVESFLRERLTPYILVIGVLTFSFLAHHRFPYSGWPRSELSSEFATPKLAGISAHSSVAATIDSLANYIKTNTADRDSIFVFPALTSLCYLTDRPAWGRTHWSYYLEYDNEMADETISRLLSVPPSLVVMEQADSAILASEVVRRKRITSAVEMNFELVDSAAGYEFYRPIEISVEDPKALSEDKN